MIGRREFAGVLLAVSALLSGCNKQERRRYQMAVTVETPQGEISGVSVRQLTLDIPPNILMLGEDKPQFYMQGEAVAIDLPNDQTLFALLSGADGDVDYGSRILDRINMWNEPPSTPAQSLYPEAPKTQGLARTNPLPMLVTFKDIKDPTSVQRVDPDDLAASFGKGYRLKTITVQVTDEPVTVGIQKRLGAAGWEEDQGLDRTKGVTADPTLAQQLGYIDFVRR
jgi:hypothetical protein